MTTERPLAKAQLVEIKWPKPGARAEVVSGGKNLTVQFNPASLRVSYANQVQTGDQSNNASTQHVGKGSAKMSLELIFDVSLPLSLGALGDKPSSDKQDDVREVTKHLIGFMEPKPDPKAKPKEKDKMVPSGTRFVWGSFMFEGVIESLDETLDLWSEDGRPLRSTIALGLSQQGLVVGVNPDKTNAPGGAAAGRDAAGTTPLQATRAGDSVQSMVGRNGKPDDWKAVAAANNIENPRVLAPGTLLNLNPRR